MEDGVHMYSSLDLLDDSCSVFTSMVRRDSVSWNIMISGYGRAKTYLHAMEMFCSMQACSLRDIKPNAITVAVILPVCAKLRELKHGQSVHAYSIKAGLLLDTLVGNALVSMYSKCSIMDDAREAFHLIAVKDVVSWNSIIAAHTENGLFVDAIELFRTMTVKCIQPNYTTIATVLPLCTSLEQGWCHGGAIHCYALRQGLLSDLSVCNALLGHYSKTGDMVKAESVFRQMHSSDVVTWNTMISGYAINGQLHRAMSLFHVMVSSGRKPDSVTAITVLPICARLLDVQEAQKLHDYIGQDEMLSGETSVANVLISFYGECCMLDEALEVFTGFPRKDLISWNAMFKAFANNAQWAELIGLLKQMIHERIRPDSVTILSVLQACAILGIQKIKETHGYMYRASFFDERFAGNAIIDAYAKYGSLDNALRCFRTLTMKNVNLLESHGASLCSTKLH